MVFNPIHWAAGVIGATFWGLLGGFWWFVITASVSNRQSNNTDESKERAKQ
jgi:hypothetical protein